MNTNYNSCSIPATILNAADEKRLQAGLELTCAVQLTSKDKTEIHGLVGEYNVALIHGQVFCNCRDNMFRRTICKHGVGLAAYAMHHAAPEKIEQKQCDFAVGDVVTKRRNTYRRGIVKETGEYSCLVAWETAEVLWYATTDLKKM